MPVYSDLRTVCAICCYLDYQSPADAERKKDAILELPREEALSPKPLPKLPERYRSAQIGL